MSRGSFYLLNIKHPVYHAKSIYLSVRIVYTTTVKHLINSKIERPSFKIYEHSPFIYEHAKTEKPIRGSIGAASA